MKIILWQIEWHVYFADIDKLNWNHPTWPYCVVGLNETLADIQITKFQANTRHWPNVVLMLRWASIKTTLGQYLVLAGYVRLECTFPDDGFFCVICIQLGVSLDQKSLERMYPLLWPSNQYLKYKIAYSVKRSYVNGNPFEWLLGENNVIFIPPSPYFIVLGENTAGQGYWAHIIASSVSGISNWSTLFSQLSILSRERVWRYLGDIIMSDICYSIMT